MFYRQHSLIRKYSELIFVLLIFMLLDWWTEMRFTAFQPSPTLFVALLFSLRYGWGVGLIGSLMTIAYAVGAASSRGEDILLLFFDFERAKWLLFHLFLGIIPGLFITNLREQYEAQYYRNQEIIEENRQLQRAVDKLSASRQTLEGKILESEQSIHVLLDIVRTLDASDPEAIITQAAKILADYFKAEEFGIYHLDQSGTALRLKVRMGESETIKPTLFISDSRFYSRLLREKAVIMRRADDEATAPVLAGPILREGRIHEVLIISRIALERLTPQGVQFLHLLLELISDSTEIATLRLEDGADLTYPGTGIYYPEPFQRRVQIEQERKAELDQPYTVFDVPLPRHLHLRADEWDKRLAPHMREVDIVGYDKRDNKLLFLLPATDEEQTKNFIDRIMSVIFNDKEG
ncbi:hypothetical protein JQN58_07255 [Aneurinibacillus sp. BA2021]|nr:hypothetical protein [Aneurinibacillus sp. BA2021]